MRPPRNANRTMLRAVTSLAVVASFGTPAVALGAEAKPDAATSKPRGELLVGVGGSGGLSDWSGDSVGYGSVTLGLRLFGVVTPFVEGRLGAGRIDQRLLTLISIGVAGSFQATKTVAPRAFVGAVHQHEESLAAVAEQPWGALLGIGGGIRHRAGIQMGLGCDIKIFEGEKYVVTMGPELRGMYLTYSSGPSWYGQLGAVANGHFRLF